MELGDGYTKLVYGVNRKMTKKRGKSCSTLTMKVCVTAARILLG